MDNKAKIIATLRENATGLAAKEIAARINLSTQEVNSVLYASSGNLFIKNDASQPKWQYYATGKAIFKIDSYGATFIMHDLTKLQTLLEHIEGEKKLTYVRSNMTDAFLKIATSCGFSCSEIE